MPISLGVQLGQQSLPMHQLRALWRKLDRAGMDWISIWDHFYESPPKNGVEPHFEALTTLGALASETQHARIGCLVFYVGYRNPAMLAKAATTLDHISNGRFEIGLGAGWHVLEATAYGYAFPDIGTRLDMLEEAIQIVRSLLTQERTDFNGKHFQVVDASCLPAPLQQRLPIWIGGRGEKRTLKIAAEYADAWNAAYVSPEEFQRLNTILDHWCEEVDRDPATVQRTVNLSFNLGVDEEEVERRRRQIPMDWGKMSEQVLNGGALLCTPDQAVEQLAQYKAAGAQKINIALRAPWGAEALDAYLTEVVPQVRAL